MATPGVLPKAALTLTIFWWGLLLTRGLPPSFFTMQWNNGQLSPALMPAISSRRFSSLNST